MILANANRVAITGKLFYLYIWVQHPKATEKKLLFLFVAVCLFWVRVSLYRPRQPRTHSDPPVTMPLSTVKKKKSRGQNSLADKGACHSVMQAWWTLIPRTFIQVEGQTPQNCLFFFHRLAAPHAHIHNNNNFKLLIFLKLDLYKYILR